MIITPEAKNHSPQTMIEFYKKHFRKVCAITCSKCENTVAIELSEPIMNDVLGMKVNTMGIIVLPIDDNLLGSRPRLDAMMGYQCLCGNDTRASEIEEKNSPLGEFFPHEVDAIRNEMTHKSWQAPVIQKDNKEYRDTFIAERL